MSYSNIKIIGTPAPDGIPKSWNPEAYESAIRYLFRALLLRFSVSSLVIRHIRRPVIVRPYPTWNSMEAYTADAHGLEAAPRGERLRYTRDDPRTAWDETGQLAPGMAVGTGVGSESTISFTPADWERPNAPIRLHNGGGVPIYADAALAHELVHAMRSSWGENLSLRFDPRLDRDWRMGSSEEYYATIITNMYQSQRGLPLLTAYQFQVPLRFIPNSRGVLHPYVQLERRWLGRLFQQIPTLAHGLAQIPELHCEYNPFRQFLSMDYALIPDIPPRAIVPRLIGPPFPPAPLFTREDMFGPRDAP